MDEPRIFGPNEVAVQLLDDQNQHAEDEPLDRVNQQQNEDAGDRADEGPNTG